MISNATFFAGYNHLHHFHKASILYHYYHNDDAYFERVLKPHYDELELASFYFPGEESYFKRTMVLEMRNTYLHAVETMFTLLEVLRVHHERLWADPEGEELLYHLLKQNANSLYHNIEKYGKDLGNLGFMDKVLAPEWTLGRFLFYPAFNPPAAERPEYLERISTSLHAMKKGLQLMARDFMRHEYNSYKHGMRVLDAFDHIAWREGGTGAITKVTYPETFTYPRIMKEKGKRERYDIHSRPADLVRDYRMCILASRFLHMMTNNRRIAFSKDTKVLPDKIPLTLFDEARIEWHAAEHVKGTLEQMSTDEYTNWYRAQHSKRPESERKPED